LNISIEIKQGRCARVQIGPQELSGAYLHLASAELRNRTDHFMRRHAATQQQPPSPNHPVRSAQEPRKLSIPEHLREMVATGTLASTPMVLEQNHERFLVEPARLVVPISDVVANLLRPCYHRDGLGPHRVFFFEGEPIDRKVYFCVCFFSRGPAQAGQLQLRPVRFDERSDEALDPQGECLAEQGLVWAAALVPLVMDRWPSQPAQIAREDYDLRQILGRDAETEIQYAYGGWFEQWDVRVSEVVARHQRLVKPFASFYHSILAIDASGAIHILQTEGSLPELAQKLANEGMVAAGLLDSGGSCALYDPWIAGYLNHNWYYRERRGAILVFELNTTLRVPSDQSDSWLTRRRKVEACEL
jgi:hypothetical protein